MWGQLACLSFLQPSDHLATTLLPHAPVVGGLRKAEVVVGDLGEVGGGAIGRRAGRVKGRRLYTLLSMSGFSDFSFEQQVLRQQQMTTTRTMRVRTPPTTPPTSV